ncbi:MAG: ribonuclease P protein component [Candidatus Dependentiae bacterium]
MAITPYLSHLTKNEIKTVFKKARRVLRDSGLDILLYPSPTDFGRILVVTSRKVGNAPERNRVRRRLKAIFYKEKLYEHKLDCFVIIKKSGTNYSSDQLKKILHHAFALYLDKNSQ